MEAKSFIFMLLSLVISSKGSSEFNLAGGGKSNYTFANDFLFGVSTAAVQIEGAWNEDGKSESIWDHLIHTHPDFVKDHSNADAHANVYHLFDKQYRPQFGGKIGLSLDSNWAEPKTDTPRDREAAELYLKTHVGWYAHPVYSAEGNYPPELIKLVNEKSAKQNYSRSRLPEFTPSEVQFIKGTADFFGLNHYTTYLLSMADKEVGAIPSHENDVGIVRVQDPKWPSKSSSDWLKVVPFGFRRLLQWVTKTYANNTPIIVTENGYADFNGVEDTPRVSYYSHYLNALLHAIHEDKSNVHGYFAWSLMDNFEWDDGYVSRFGLYLVDFKSPNKTRTAKHSAKLYSSVVATRGLPADYDPEDFSAFSGATNLVPSMLPLIALSRLL
ncbi:hypothetical protein O0L34_g9538 [Tuta absoluta]|nr:hypothetical protein O0L34_g9538 [Tuta absoluta]